VSKQQAYLPYDLADDWHFGKSADGSPAIRVGAMMTERQAREFVAWYTLREVELKAGKWRSWNPGDQVERTLCVQLESYGRAVFGHAI